MKRLLPRSWWGPTRRSRSVSTVRRAIGFAVLLLITAGFYTYHRLTDENRLRRYAEQWLEDFSGGEAVIDRVRFDLSEGLYLIGVTLATPPSAPFDRADPSLARRAVFKSDTLFLRLRPWSLLTGDLVVPEIVAVNPQVTVAHRLTDGKWNWELMFEHRRPRSGGGRIRLPEIRLRNALLVQHRLDERGWVLGAPRRIWAEARPADGRPEVYEVAVTQLATASGSDEVRRDVARIEINMRTLAVAGSLPQLELEHILAAAPPEVSRWLDVMALRGQVRADTFHYDPEAGGAATLSLRDAGISIPMSPEERPIEPDERFFRFDEVSGTLEFAGRQAHARLEGRFRGHPLTLEGSLHLAGDSADGLAGIGFDVRLTITGLSLPRDDPNADPAERRFIRTWHEVAKFVEDFDGIGPVDIAAHLSKEPDIAATARFVEGTITFQGCSARYIKFPYRLSDLSGVVHFRPDGKIELKDVTGANSTGTGTVVVNGLLGGGLSKEGDLQVTARNLALDEALLACLDERDRALCRRFHPVASADVKVHMIRPAALHEEPTPKWNSVIEVDLKEGSVCFDGFPYPLDQLSGTIRIAGGRLEVDRLCGRRGEATVCISGTAVDAKGAFELDLQVEARAVPLDEMLARALPPSGRALYERFALSGTANITGRLFTAGSEHTPQCDFLAELTDAALTVPSSQLKLSNVRARVRVRPDELLVESLEGRFRDALVRVDGRLPVTGDDANIMLHAFSEDVALDAELRGVLPESLQKIWDTFQPRGSAGIDIRYRRGRSISRPAPLTTSPADPVTDYTVVVRPRQCAMLYEAFPLPLQDVTGTITISPAGVAIEHLTARHEETSLAIKGNIDFLEDVRRVVLGVDARDVRFTEALRQAMPWRLRRLWNDVKPAGRADLNFRRLAGDIVPGERTVWKFDGKADLTDVSLAVGPGLDTITGQVQAVGSFGEQFAIQGDLTWSRVRVNRRLATDLSARFSQPAGDAVLQLNNILGTFYGGTIIGRVEIDNSRRRPAFGLSLTAKDVSLSDFLNANLKPDQTPVHVSGVAEGNLVLTGRFDEPASRHGGGTVLIHEAQILKIPFFLAMLQVVHLAIDDDNAFHDARLSFIVDGGELVFEEIDLRGKALSMVGAGRVETDSEKLNLALLVGSPLRLPRLEVLSELMEGVAREVVEVHVEGTLSQPTYRADIVRSLSKTLEMLLNMRHRSVPDSSTPR